MSCDACGEARREMRAAFVEGEILKAVALAGKGAADLARHLMTGEAPKGRDEQPRPDA